MKLEMEMQRWHTHGAADDHFELTLKGLSTQLALALLITLRAEGHGVLVAAAAEAAGLDLPHRTRP